MLAMRKRNARSASFSAFFLFTSAPTSHELLFGLSERPRGAYLRRAIEHDTNEYIKEKCHKLKS
jgi:hypothetical protein